MKNMIGETELRVFTISNGLSFLRLLLAIPVALLVQDVANNRWWIFGLCWIVYVTDISDGLVARHFNQESNFGRIIDPLADKIFVGAFAVALTVSGLLPLWFLCVVVIRDLLILIGGIYLKKRTRQIVQSNYPGKVAVMTVGLCLVATLFKESFSESAYLIALLSSTGMLILSFIGYGKKFLALITAVK